MTEISYWRILDFALGMGEESIVVAISIPFKWNKMLQMDARGVGKVCSSTHKVNYYLNLIVVENDSFKYYTKNKVLPLVEKVLSNKDLYLSYFRAGQISIGPVNEVNEKVKGLFRYPIRLRTDRISISMDDKMISMIINKKIKKS